MLGSGVRLLLPHALTLYRWPEVSKEERLIIDLLSKTSLYLCLQGRWREGQTIDNALLKPRRKVLSEKHPDTIKSMTDLATTYHQRG
jgi:hypothetical protein